MVKIKNKKLKSWASCYDSLRTHRFYGIPTKKQNLNLMRKLFQIETLYKTYGLNSSKMSILRRKMKDQGTLADLKVHQI